ncbi:transporter substrate-binding protein [Vibrio sp. MA40-2]|uniref:transporter substrate-binding protein n=1 Tax=Vibrio sp. MA40-2 TaxID=3391828 RepID=UPI0039A43596
MKHQVPIGLIYSTQGTYKHMGTNAYLGALYAIQQINKANSLNIELIADHRDPKGNLDHYVTAVNDLLAQDIHHIFGTITSSARKEVLPDIQKADGMLWYASPYEGYECDENVVYHGPCPNQNLLPLLSYIIPNYGKRAALVASNYIWGWESNRIASELLSAANGEVVLERCFHLDDLDFSATISAVIDQSPSFVVNNLVGESSYAFLEQLNAQWSQDPLAVLSCNLTECELSTLPNFANLKLITAAPFFESVNPEFVAKVKNTLGNVPVSAYFMGAYLSIYSYYYSLVKELTNDTAKLRSTLQSICYPSPTGESLSIAANQHAILPCYIGLWHNGQFQLLHTKNQSQPNPFLTAKNFLDVELLGTLSDTTPTLRLIS